MLLNKSIKKVNRCSNKELFQNFCNVNYINVKNQSYLELHVPSKWQDTVGSLIFNRKQLNIIKGLYPNRSHKKILSFL